MISVSDLVKEREYLVVSLPKGKNQRLIEIGITEGETIKLLHKAPFNGPICIELQRQRIALRLDEAKRIMCEPKPEND